MIPRHQNLLFLASEEILLLLDTTQLRILAASPGSLLPTGRPEEALVGLEIGEIECALADVFFWEEVRQHGLPEPQTLEGLYRRGDGSLFQARKSVSACPEGILVRAVNVESQTGRGRTGPAHLPLASHPGSHCRRHSGAGLPGPHPQS